MAASLHRLFRQRQGWTNAERAQFARIERLLADTGLAVDVEHGESDEGEPWCVFCARASGDVMIHAACIDGRFMIDSPMLPRPIEGRSFERCAERFFEDCRLPMALSDRRNAVMLHPSALLASLFLTILLYAQASGEQTLFGLDPVDADADRADGSAPGQGQGLTLRLKSLAQQIADYVSGSETGQPQPAAGGAAMAAIPAGMALAAIAIAEDLARAGVHDAEAAGAHPPSAGESGADGDRLALRPGEEGGDAPEAQERRAADQAAADAVTEEDEPEARLNLAALTGTAAAAEAGAPAAMPDTDTDTGEPASLTGTAAAIGAALSDAVDGFDLDLPDLAALFGGAGEAGTGDTSVQGAGDGLAGAGLEMPAAAAEAFVAYLVEMVADVVATSGEVETGSGPVLVSLAGLFDGPGGDADAAAAQAVRVEIALAAPAPTAEATPFHPDGSGSERIEFAAQTDGPATRDQGLARDNATGRFEPTRGGNREEIAHQDLLSLISFAEESDLPEDPDWLWINIYYGDLAHEGGSNAAINAADIASLSFEAPQTGREVTFLVARWEFDDLVTDLLDGWDGADALLT